MSVDDRNRGDNRNRRYLTCLIDSKSPKSMRCTRTRPDARRHHNRKARRVGEGFVKEEGHPSCSGAVVELGSGSGQGSGKG